MLSKRQLRNDIKAVEKALMKRNFSFDAGALSDLEDKRKKNQIAIQGLQNLRNTQSKLIGKTKAAGENIKPLLDSVVDLGDKLNTAKIELQSIQKKLILL